MLRLLASNHDGERAAAGAMAAQMIRDRGIDWESIISDGHASMPLPASFQPRVATVATATLLPLIQFLSGRRTLMTVRQGEFFTSIRQRRRLTPRQVEVLRDIVRQVAEREARA
jgi:hypothetical protein